MEKKISVNIDVNNEDENNCGVVSFKIAKKLNKLMGERTSQFSYWRIGKNTVLLSSETDSGDSYICPAFTVAELGEMLPCVIGDKCPQLFLVIRKMERWEVGYENPVTDISGAIYTQSDTEADARGKMLIYLLENKLIKGE
jgi:hypothetical protein